MSRREKIIVGSALICLLYGGYTFFFKKTDVRYSRNKVDVSNIEQGIWSKLNSDRLTPAEMKALSILRQRSRDPFLYLKEPTKKDNTTLGTNNLSLDYNGFVYVGNKKFAIINGREYGEGESLDIDGYKVVSIFKDKVIIKGPGKRNFIIIPFVDELKTK